jgi:hypothetical protein
LRHAPAMERKIGDARTLHTIILAGHGTFGRSGLLQ